MLSKPGQPFDNVETTFKKINEIFTLPTVSRYTTYDMICIS